MSALGKLPCFCYSAHMSSNSTLFFWRRDMSGVRPFPTRSQPKLLEQVRDAIRARHYSLRTEEAYVRWVKRFILFHDKRHPRDMGLQEGQPVLPQQVKDPLQQHLQTVKQLHEADLQVGAGHVYLPYALERKYPNAHREWIWQYVFPATKLSQDPRTGLIRRHHAHRLVLQRAVQ